ncbi:YbhN family protein [Tardiphaga sp.]|uniref:lysylphosphatidylglycerol synthase transmembrane domain-containing protein n=1 Tax=Tardiphaga sp. TaxID=1926292 RepID=UPI0025DAB7AF|nr:YbhN family protein [Tardiphaga sp.]
MQRMLTALGRGFKRYIGWKRLGVAVSLVVIGLAITHLVRTLKGVDAAVILSAIAEKSPMQIALAALCVLGAFGTLTFYDYFALKTIGKTHVPYRIAALSSFTSYTIGHNIGATVFTGGAIRFRIYSDYGLSAIDVAKICFISGLTFWLGNTFVLGIGMIWHPQAASAMDLLPDAVNRMIGCAGLAGIAAYLAWLSVGKGRRELGQNGWKVTLPSARLTLLQILIGVVDLGFCALAMYLLVPNDPGIDFVSLAVVFILATLLGFASHAPGSLGVFDAAMLVALPQFGREQLVATLVMFRILYFLIPFAVAIAIMGSRELWLSVVIPWQRGRAAGEAQRLAASSAVAPRPVKRQAQG